MGCVQSYFRRARNAGISPSSTQDSNSKQAASEDGTRQLQEGHSITEEPESNDTSYGVEATAVRTLAASTGTVAILGTTAKTGDKREDKGGISPGVSETILEAEEQEEGLANQERAEIHEEKKVEVSRESETKSKPASSTSRPSSSQLDENVSKKDESLEDSSPPSTSNTIKENHATPENSNKSPVSESNKSEVTSPDVKSPLAETPKLSSAEENSLELVVSELPKEKEEDLSKSLSSERLKTNSLSNTTLSSDSIAAEFDNGSIKQSPSIDKVVESFDSSSTVEFVDHLKDSVKGTLTQNDQSNPARSISSDLSNKANLPEDFDKTFDVTLPVAKEDTNDLSLPPPPEVLENPESNGQTENLDEALIDNFTNGTLKVEDNLSKDAASDEVSISEVSSNVSSSLQSVVRNDSNVQEENSKSAVVSGSPNISEDKDKAETGSPLSSDNNSSFNDNGDATSPVIAVILSPAPPKEVVVNHNEDRKSEKSDSIVSEKSNNISLVTNGTNLTSEESSNTSLEKNTLIDADLGTNVSKENISNKIVDNVSFESQINGKGLEDLEIDITDEKVVAAATTIQASFRGFQTRQNLKSNEIYDKSSAPESNETLVKNSFEKAPSTPDSVRETATEIVDSIIEEVDEKMVQAATTIQANFRGFQTRKTLTNKLDSGLPPSEELNQSPERKTPTAMTPELIESVKEEVEEICKEAEIIAAERAESADGMKGVQQVVVGIKEYGLPSVSSVKAVRGSVTPPSVSEAFDITDDAKEEVFESLSEADDRTVDAATKIQATFRGFQTRKQLQDKDQDPSDTMPNYPPPAPAEEDCPISLEDLPPPDFEALESSYSEDAPTEPLAPPPDPLIFNEEDEDELAALQRPQECDELPEHRLTLETDSSDSSLSSAATKIQAGVRGYLTRKQIQAQGPNTGTGGTTSTSTITSTLLDSDQSLSVSREEDGVRSAISTEEESEVTRHLASPEAREAQTEAESTKLIKSAGKRMSLAEPSVSAQKRAPLRTAMSVQVVSDDEVWNTLKDEMSDAATRIQSNFRGYRARKQLQREDAMQVTTSGSSQATPSSGSVEAGGRGSAASEVSPREEREKPTRSSGEFHDIIALTPPNLLADGAAPVAQSQISVSSQSAGALADDMVKRRAEDQEDAREAAAATKIQAGFRGYKARRELSQEEKAASKIQAGFRGYKVRKEMKRSTSDTGDKGQVRLQHMGSAEETAATKIQAGVRGFLVRRRNQNVQNKKEEEAATKIQAGFRGYHARKQVQSDQ